MKRAINKSFAPRLKLDLDNFEQTPEININNPAKIGSMGVKKLKSK